MELIPFFSRSLVIVPHPLRLVDVELTFFLLFCCVSCSARPPKILSPLLLGWLPMHLSDIVALLIAMFCDNLNNFLSPHSQSIHNLTLFFFLFKWINFNFHLFCLSGNDHSALQCRNFYFIRWWLLCLFDEWKIF